MSLETSTNAIRDYCVEAVKTAWPGVTVSHEPAEIRDTPPIARVNMLEPQIGGDIPGASVGIDACRLQFEIVGRFAKVANLSDAVSEKVNDLRLALLSDVNPGTGDVGYNPYVVTLDNSQLETMDTYYEAGVVFECYVLAPRS